MKLLIFALLFAGVAAAAERQLRGEQQLLGDLYSGGRNEYTWGGGGGGGGIDRLYPSSPPPPTTTTQLAITMKRVAALPERITGILVGLKKKKPDCSDQDSIQQNHNNNNSPGSWLNNPGDGVNGAFCNFDSQGKVCVRCYLFHMFL